MCNCPFWVFWVHLLFITRRGKCFSCKVFKVFQRVHQNASFLLRLLHPFVVRQRTQGMESWLKRECGNCLDLRTQWEHSSGNRKRFRFFRSSIWVHVVNKLMHLVDTISCLFCGAVWQEWIWVRWVNWVNPCNKLHAVSFVAAHSTRDVKQNVQDLTILTHFNVKKQELPEPPQSPDQGAFPECCVQTCKVYTGCGVQIFRTCRCCWEFWIGYEIFCRTWGLPKPWFTVGQQSIPFTKSHSDWFSSVLRQDPRIWTFIKIPWNPIHPIHPFPCHAAVRNGDSFFWCQKKRSDPRRWWCRAAPTVAQGSVGFFFSAG